MTIASITLDPVAMKSGDYKAATTQIAIELYAPLPGGLAAGGRFAEGVTLMDETIRLRLITRRRRLQWRF